MPVVTQGPCGRLCRALSWALAAEREGVGASRHIQCCVGSTMFLAVRADVVKLFSKSDHDSETKPDTVPAPGGPTLAVLLEPDSLASSPIIGMGTLQSPGGTQRAQVTQGCSQQGCRH